MLDNVGRPIVTEEHIEFRMLGLLEQRQHKNVELFLVEARHDGRVVKRESFEASMDEVAWVENARDPPKADRVLAFSESDHIRLA